MPYSERNWQKINSLVSEAQFMLSELRESRGYCDMDDLYRALQKLDYINGTFIKSVDATKRMSTVELRASSDLLYFMTQVLLRVGMAAMVKAGESREGLLYAAREAMDGVEAALHDMI